MSDREVRRVAVSSIRTRNRTRQDLGNLDSLAASLRKNGLLHPLVVTEDLTLIAGHRRLEAARLLGWQEIDCTVLSGNTQEELLQMELDENAVRKEFTSDEMADALLRLDRIRNPSGLKRLGRYLAGLGSRIWHAITAPFRFLSRLGVSRRGKTSEDEAEEILPPTPEE